MRFKHLSPEDAAVVQSFRLTLNEGCSPTVAVSHDYPHHLTLSCWEHGDIADLGYAVKADTIAQHVAKHRAENPAT